MFHTKRYPRDSKIRTSQQVIENFQGKSYFLEFIQNALDARADQSQPVEVKFILERTKEYKEDLFGLNKIINIGNEDKDFMNNDQ